MHRFYITPETWNPEDLTLGESESHHCLNVLRLEEGDKVIAFDGRGSEVNTSIATAAKGAVKLAPAPAQPPRPRNRERGRFRAGSRISLATNTEAFQRGFQLFFDFP